MDAAAPVRRWSSPEASSWWERDTVDWLVADEDAAAMSGIRLLVGARLRLTVCADGAEALWLAGRLRPRTVILSASLPVVSPAEVADVLCRKREGRQTVLVGVGAGEADRAGAVLAAGASGLLSRPYPAAEIEPLVRQRLQEVERLRRDRAVLVVGGLRLDGPAFEASAAGRPLRLSLREFELLRLLMAHTDAVVTPEDIRRELWETRGESVSTNTIAVHVRHLRVHLAGVAEITAVRGVGYRLRATSVETDGTTRRTHE